YDPKPGQLYLLPARVRQSYGVRNGNTIGKYWCHFSAAIGDLSLFQLLRVPAYITVTNPEAVVAQFQQLIHYSQSQTLTSTLRVHAILLELIASFIEQAHNVQWNMSLTPSF